MNSKKPWQYDRAFTGQSQTGPEYWRWKWTQTYTPQPRNHLHLITIYKWNISFLQRCFSGYTNLHEPWRPDPMPRSRRLTQKKFSVVMRLISLIMICLGISFLFCYRSFAYTSWFLMLHFYGICVFANICVSEYICVTFALSLPLCFFHLFV